MLLEQPPQTPKGKTESDSLLNVSAYMGNDGNSLGQEDQMQLMDAQNCLSNSVIVTQPSQMVNASNMILSTQCPISVKSGSTRKANIISR